MELINYYYNAETPLFSICSPVFRSFKHVYVFCLVSEEKDKTLVYCTR